MLPANQDESTQRCAQGIGSYISAAGSYQGVNYLMTLEYCLSELPFPATESHIEKPVVVYVTNNFVNWAYLNRLR